jgi:RNA polymerase sigma-70 factor (ECF subfamily)
MDQTSISLLSRMAGDPGDAWAEFDRLYRPFIRTWVVRMGLAEPDDTVQEVMLAVVRSLPDFERRRPGSFRRWLQEITRNRVRSAFADKNRAPTTAQSDALAQLADEGSELARRWDQEHDRYVIGRATDMLATEVEPSTYQAFVRTALLGERPPAVAEELGITVQAVYSARHRAQSRLAELLRGLLD